VASRVARVPSSLLSSRADFDDEQYVDDHVQCSWLGVSMKHARFFLALKPGLAASAQLPNGSTAPDFTLTDYHGVTRQAMPLRSKLDDPRMANNSARERHPQEIGSLRKRG
jgi:hypothetical protein